MTRTDDFMASLETRQDYNRQGNPPVDGPGPVVQEDDTADLTVKQICQRLLEIDDRVGRVFGYYGITGVRVTEIRDMIIDLVSDFTGKGKIRWE
jgi:hypothetical protein